MKPLSLLFLPLFPLCALAVQPPTILPTPRSASFDGGEMSCGGFDLRDEAGVQSYAREFAAKFPPGDCPLRMVRDDSLGGQAYRLKAAADGVEVAARDDAGFVYALATLWQMTHRAPDGSLVVATGSVEDAPQFSVRGVNWNLFVEARGWSQDAGDGLEKLRRRFVSGLDTLAFFKLNAVLVDGFGWNPERFPGYAKLMRELGDEARRRGISLGFGGYSAGYGAQWLDTDGPAFTNLTDGTGAPYECYGFAGRQQAKMGTCLSNAWLTGGKLANFGAFVRAVRPGFLYLHGADLSRERDVRRAWTNRCAACRARWPNDEPAAADGMAGAFAELYDAFASEVPEDCALHVISPNYSSYRESDEEWAFHVRYFSQVFSCMRNRRTRLMLREQYIGGDGSPRFLSLRRAVGPSARLSTIVFGAGDAYLNTLPVTGEPALSGCFVGVDEVIAASGNAFQEPRQVLWAEYLWNPLGSAYDAGWRGKSRGELMTMHTNLLYGVELPRSIFAPGGLLEEACARLYGRNTGRLVAEALTPATVKGERGEAVVAPMFPLCNERMPGSPFSRFRKNRRDIRWRDGLGEAGLRDIREERRQELLALAATRRAAEVFRRAAAEGGSGMPFAPEMRAAALRRLADVCADCAMLGELTARWLELMDLAYGCMAGTGDKAECLRLLDALDRDVVAAEGRFLLLARRTLDASGGNANDGLRTARYLKVEAGNIRRTLTDGTYLPHPSERWW